MPDTTIQETTAGAVKPSLGLRICSGVIVVWSVLGLALTPWNAVWTFSRNSLKPGGMSAYLVCYLVIYTLAHSGLGITGAVMMLRGRSRGRGLFLWYWPAMLFGFWMLFGFDATHIPGFALYAALVWGLARRTVSEFLGADISAAGLNQIAILLALGVVFMLFALVGPAGFSTPRNLETITRQTAIVGTAALGMTFIIIAGGIDLSVGSTIALSTVVVAALLQYFSIPPLLAALGGVAIGIAAGTVSGLVITKLRVLPFIVTLGMMLVLRGVAKWWAAEQKIDAPMTWLNELVAAVPASRRWMVLPPGVWVMILFAVGVFVLLNYTRFGRHTFAIGSNEETARLCGVSVERTKVAIYALGGGFAGLAGLMQFSRLTVGDPTVATGTELDVIAAVVIGGGSLAGGEGSVLGSIVGAFIMTVISAGCAQLGLPNFVQQIVTGAIIVLAVALDRLRRRRVG